MNVINKNQIIINSKAKTKNEVFLEISLQAFKLKIVNNVNKTVKGFKEREKESSTGFEDGFAIPHTRIDSIIKPALFYVKLNEPIKWPSMDGSLTDTIIAILVPYQDAGTVHLELLSKIAVGILNENIKKELKLGKSKESILKVFEKIQNSNSDSNEKKQAHTINVTNQFKIIGITSCVVGIAHTYLAEEKLLKAANEMGYQMRIETHGSRGILSTLSEKEINDADLVILACDTSVDQSRFVNKKIYKTKPSTAIKDPQSVIKKAISEGQTFKKNSQTANFTNEKGKKVASEDKVIQHILSGISYMIPIIVLGGICLAFSIGIAKAIWGPGAGTSGPNGEYPNNPLAVLDKIGGAAFALMIPILAGFIANSIAGRAAIVPAMLGGFIGNNTVNFANWIPGLEKIESPMGFIGSIIAGLSVGYYVRWVNTWKVPRSLAPAMPIFFIPITAGVGISIVFIYVIGTPVGFVMDKISSGISSAYTGNVGIFVGLMMGLLIGAMAGFDMGGPINKIAFVTCSFLITEGVSQPMGAMSAAIPVAPIGMGISTIMFKKFFDENERQLGIAAIIMGTIGISEGAIPFAIRDPKRAIICNVAGSLVAGGIAGVFLITDEAAHGGPIVAILGAVPYGVMTFYYFLAMSSGILVTVALYGLWLQTDAGEEGSAKETFVIKLQAIKQICSEKIQTLKKSLEQSPSSKDEVKLKINQIKKEYLIEIQKLKESYKMLAKKEKEFIKSPYFKNEFNKIKADYKEGYVKLSTQEFDSKQEKHNQIMKLKTSRTEKINNLKFKKQNNTTL